MIIARFDVGGLALWIQFQADEFFVCHDQLINLLAVLFPNLSRELHPLEASVCKVGTDDDRHHQATDVVEPDDVKVCVAT